MMIGMLHKEFSVKIVMPTYMLHASSATRPILLTSYLDNVILQWASVVNSNAVYHRSNLRGLKILLLATVNMLQVIIIAIP
jgi:hypothetical protein